MTDIIKTIDFIPKTLSEIIGEKEAKIIEEENPDEDGFNNNLTCYNISIIVDGFHIRNPIVSKGNLKKPKDKMHEMVAAWLHCVQMWVLYEFIEIAEQKHDGISLRTVGYDAMLNENPRDEKLFSDKNKLERFRKCRFTVNGEIKVMYTSATWHVCSLKVRKGGIAFQSGVDARIATELLVEANEGADLIVLVTGDSDFAPAISYIKSKYNIEVCVLSYNDLSDKKDLRKEASRFYLLNENSKLEGTDDFVLKRLK
ncbi:hypothetical protein AZ09_14560 (plasmid) [Acetobacter aceti 1023]|nr:hypothetical protein AZ09_14560 [Acetobacter aceti 1023]